MNQILNFSNNNPENAGKPNDVNKKKPEENVNLDDNLNILDDIGAVTDIPENESNPLMDNMDEMDLMGGFADLDSTTFDDNDPLSSMPLDNNDVVTNTDDDMDGILSGLDDLPNDTPAVDDSFNDIMPGLDDNFTSEPPSADDSDFGNFIPEADNSMPNNDFATAGMGGVNSIDDNFNVPPTNNNNNNFNDFSKAQKPGKGVKGGSDTLVRAFAIILIVFAVAMICVGVYNNISNREMVDDSDVIADATDAKITLEKQEENSTVKISVKHDKAIEKVIYVWNSEKETTLKADGKNTFETEIKLANGKNTLVVKVVDVDKHETTTQEVFETSSGLDITPPKINLSVTDDKKLKIVAKDETEIKFISYTWNDEEPVTVNAESGQTELETEIEILRGTNDIVISACDVAQNVSTETKSFDGKTKPVVSITVSPDGKVASIRITHERGIKEITGELNGQLFNVDLGGETPQEYSFDISGLVDGDNQLKIVASSIEDTSATYADTIVSKDLTNAKPEISVTQEGNILHVSIHSDLGLSGGTILMNESVYNVSFQGTEIALDGTFNLELVDQETRVVISIDDINGNGETFDKTFVMQ